MLAQCAHSLNFQRSLDFVHLRHTSGRVNSRFLLAALPLALVLSHSAHAQTWSTVGDVSVTGPRDMAYDNVGKQLYVTTDAGRVQVFNLPARTANGSIQVGTNLRGIDISPDRAKLAVGNSDGGRISIISLPSREVTHYPLTSASGSGGTTSCAFIDNNRLVVGGRVLDLATGVFAAYGQSFYSEGIVAANASRSVIAFTEAGSSGGVAGTYEPLGGHTNLRGQRMVHLRRRGFSFRKPDRRPDLQRLLRL
jgi:hypothetical protein